MPGYTDDCHDGTCHHDECMAEFEAGCSCVTQQHPETCQSCGRPGYNDPNYLTYSEADFRKATT